MKKFKDFLVEILTEGNPKSSRRFVTLLVAGLFIVTCATILILLICLFISTTKLQGLNSAALNIIVELLKDVLKYEMFIILAGLFFTTVSARFKLLDVFSSFFNRKTTEIDGKTTTVTNEGEESSSNHVPPPGDA